MTDFPFDVHQLPNLTPRFIFEEGVKIGYQMRIDEENDTHHTQKPQGPSGQAGQRDMGLAELTFSGRTLGCFMRGEIHSLRELLDRTEHELLQIRQFGPTNLAEVKEVLSAKGLSLRRPFAV